jgi:hypothetical protein
VGLLPATGRRSQLLLALLSVEPARVSAPCPLELERLTRTSVRLHKRVWLMVDGPHAVLNGNS